MEHHVPRGNTCVAWQGDEAGLAAVTEQLSKIIRHRDEERRQIIVLGEAGSGLACVQRARVLQSEQCGERKNANLFGSRRCRRNMAALNFGWKARSPGGSVLETRR